MTASSVRTSWPGPPRRHRRAERMRWNGIRLLLGLIVVAVGCVAAISFIQAVAFPGRPAGARPVDITSLLPNAGASVPTTAEPTAQIANSGAVVQDSSPRTAGAAAPGRRVTAGYPQTTRTPARPSPSTTAARTSAPRPASSDDPHASNSASTDGDESDAGRSDDDSGDRSETHTTTKHPDPDRGHTTGPATRPGRAGSLPGLECSVRRPTDQTRRRDSDRGDRDHSDCR